MKTPRDSGACTEGGGSPLEHKEVQKITCNRGCGVGLRDPGTRIVGVQAGSKGHPYLEQDTAQKAMTRHARDTCAHTHSARGNPGLSWREGYGVLASRLRAPLLSRGDIASRSTLRSVLSERKERKARRACCPALPRSFCSPPVATETVSKCVCKGDTRGAPGDGPQTPLPTLGSAHKCPLSRVCPQWWEHLVSNSHLPTN